MPFDREARESDAASFYFRCKAALRVKSSTALKGNTIGSFSEHRTKSLAIINRL